MQEKHMGANVVQTAKQEQAPQFLIAGRLALLALALCAASFMISFSESALQNWIFAILGCLFAANLLLVIWFRINPESRWLRRFQSGLDIGIVTGIVYCTGGIASPYLFLYLPLLFVARIYGSFRNAAATAAAAIISYAAVAYLSSSDSGESAQFIQSLIVQVIILTASMSLVIVCAQHLILTISNKEAQVNKSRLALMEQSREQFQLIEKLPYGVITLDKSNSIVRANQKAAQLLEKQSESINGRSIAGLLSEVTGLEISIDRKKGKSFLNGMPTSLFSYEFIESSSDTQQSKFFIFRRGNNEEMRQDPNLLQLEDRLRELLSGTQNRNQSLVSISSRNFIAESLVMKKVFSLIERSAASDATVLIQGESGTGKELVARALHENSSRAENSFVTINCGAIPESLIESTLFGHKKGAFTSAVSDSIGLVREADGGTLFLDEIGELPIQMQAKLLRVLQERTVRAVGGDRDFEVDVRIIAATNRNLKSAIQEGKFRDDLFYRLNVINIPLPALRERKEDLPVLIHTFLEKLSTDDKHDGVVNISSDAMQILLNYDYPGNVRELENILERSFVLGSGSILSEHLSDLLPQSAETKQNSLAKSETRIIESEDLSLPLSLDQLLESIEKKYMLLALEKTQGHRTKAAELLGINLRSFRYRAQKLGL